MVTWVLVGVVAWVLLSVPLALLVGAALEHGERVPRGPRRSTVPLAKPAPARLAVAEGTRRLAS
jgi:hypothetical protein